jgi:biopolymer transport protein ExbD
VIPKPLLVAGVSTLLVGLTAPLAIRSWLNSQITEPVHALLTVDSEKVQEIPFKISLPATYWVDIRMDSGADIDSEVCSPTNLPRPRWMVKRLPEWYEWRGNPWESSSDSSFGYASGDGLTWIGFEAPPGTYRLVMEFPRGTECLKARHPRLEIRANDLGSYVDVGNLVSELFHYLAAVGSAFVPWALAIWLRRCFSKGSDPRLFPEILPRNHLPLLHPRPMHLITQLPNFGLIYGSLLWILIFIFMIVVPFSPKGLLIQLNTHESAVWEKSPWQETVSVYLAVGEKYYVNGRLVSRDSLRSRLLQELSHRLVWTVYFEGDYDALNMDAIYAMDTIQGLGARLIWITPKIREELEHRSGAAVPPAPAKRRGSSDHCFGRVPG